jgi:hypothetical protein
MRKASNTEAVMVLLFPVELQSAKELKSKMLKVGIE